MNDCKDYGNIVDAKVLAVEQGPLIFLLQRDQLVVMDGSFTRKLIKTYRTNKQAETLFVISEKQVAIADQESLTLIDFYAEPTFVALTKGQVLQVIKINTDIVYVEQREKAQELCLVTINGQTLRSVNMQTKVASNTIAGNHQKIYWSENCLENNILVNRIVGSWFVPTQSGNGIEWDDRATLDLPAELVAIKLFQNSSLAIVDANLLFYYLDSSLNSLFTLQLQFDKQFSSIDFILNPKNPTSIWMNVKGDGVISLFKLTSDSQQLVGRMTIEAPILDATIQPVAAIANQSYKVQAVLDSQIVEVRKVSQFLTKRVYHPSQVCEVISQFMRFDQLIYEANGVTYLFAVEWPDQKLLILKISEDTFERYDPQIAGVCLLFERLGSIKIVLCDGKVLYYDGSNFTQEEKISDQQILKAKHFEQATWIYTSNQQLTVIGKGVRHTYDPANISDFEVSRNQLGELQIVECTYQGQIIISRIDDTYSRQLMVTIDYKGTIEKVLSMQGDFLLITRESKYLKLQGNQLETIYALDKAFCFHSASQSNDHILIRSYNPSMNDAFVYDYDIETKELRQMAVDTCDPFREISSFWLIGQYAYDGERLYVLKKAMRKETLMQRSLKQQNLNHIMKLAYIGDVIIAVLAENQIGILDSRFNIVSQSTLFSPMLFYQIIGKKHQAITQNSKFVHVLLSQDRNWQVHTDTEQTMELVVITAFSHIFVCEVIRSPVTIIQQVASLRANPQIDIHSVYLTKGLVLIVGCDTESIDFYQLQTTFELKYTFQTTRLHQNQQSQVDVLHQDCNAITGQVVLSLRILLLNNLLRAYKVQITCISTNSSPKLVFHIEQSWQLNHLAYPFYRFIQLNDEQYLLFSKDQRVHQVQVQKHAFNDYAKVVHSGRLADTIQSIACISANKWVAVGASNRIYEITLDEEIYIKEQ